MRLRMADQLLNLTRDLITIVGFMAILVTALPTTWMAIVACALAVVFLGRIYYMVEIIMLERMTDAKTLRVSIKKEEDKSHGLHIL